MPNGLWGRPGCCERWLLSFDLGVIFFPLGRFGAPKFSQVGNLDFLLGKLGFSRNPTLSMVKIRRNQGSKSVLLFEKMAGLPQVLSASSCVTFVRKIAKHRELRSLPMVNFRQQSDPGRVRRP